jgi:glycosyltransferase involved in cell wall biosynthesis
MTARAPSPSTSLSIVIPVYNEPDWIRRCVADAVEAARSSPFAEVTELVIVDDGSDQPTKDALNALPAELPIRVIRQENRGRFEARRAGIEAASGDLVLLLDSRVLIDSDALRFVSTRIDGELPVWNGHVEVDVARNPFARFWRTVAFAAWPDYLRNPRTMSFGLDDYDRYPKGTTCFLAPRESLMSALTEFRSLYDDPRFANDDTVLIRSIAERQRINLSPGFACRYHARESLERFLRHSFHRGTVFVDGFGRPGTRFFPVVVAFFPASVAFALLTAKKPLWAGALAASVPLLAAAFATRLRRPPADVVAFAALSGPFAAAYSAGIWRGGAMAVRARLG